MNCPNCKKEIVADRMFCIWCETFVPSPTTGSKAGVFRRWVATVVDFIVLGVIVALFFGLASAKEGASMALVFTLVYAIVFLWLLSRGLTLGKWILGERVVDKVSGRNPGIVKMIFREVIGKFISSAFFSLGYWWAIWDKDSQAWHDKIAGTVVVRRGLKQVVETQIA
ncbi:MAG: RDD family protein [Chloroflexi bacterium]|nr:RDD family protein [Chloroflexota bacterium]